jgi:hypothetical protein
MKYQAEIDALFNKIKSNNSESKQEALTEANTFILYEIAQALERIADLRQKEYDEKHTRFEEDLL